MSWSACDRLWFTIEREFGLRTVWGVDLGIRSLYIARLEGTALVLESRVLRRDRVPRGDELAQLLHFAQESFADDPGVVGIEEPPLAGTRNPRTFLGLAQASGVAAAAAGSRAVLVPVSHWKIRTVGNGAASKDLVARWLRRHHPDLSRACAGDQNYVDATCVALCAQMDTD